MHPNMAYIRQDLDPTQLNPFSLLGTHDDVGWQYDTPTPRAVSVSPPENGVTTRQK
jgi:hypothetical protein